MDSNSADHLAGYARCTATCPLIDWRTAMTRPSILVAAVLTLIALPPLFSTMTAPAAAQEQEGNDSELSDGDLRDLLRDWVGGRPERRDMLIDLLQERRDRRADLMDRMHDRRDRRDRLRERISSSWDDDEEDGGWRDRGDVRGRLRERLAERHGGNCYFLTRSLRDEDRTLLVIVRRRVCRD
jgi:hypothetical protein